MTKARSNATANAAKGDLTVGNGTNLSGVLGVGNNGDTIVADSSTSTGLRYTAGNPIPNPVINSAMQVWQRGTSISIPASTGQTYTADRWVTYTNANQACTISRQATGDSTNLPNIQYAMRFQRNSGQTGTSSLVMSNMFESINSVAYAGKTVTFSFYARAGANYSASTNRLDAYLVSGTGTDQNYFAGFTNALAVATNNATLTTTWQRYTVTGTVASNVSQLAIVLITTPTGTAGAADYYDITGVQIDIGSVALPFRTYAGTIQGELSACQRYYQRAANTSTYAPYGYGTARTTIQADIVVSLPVTMRVAPTAIDYSTLKLFSPGVASFALSSMTIDSSSNTYVTLLPTTTGLTQFRSYLLGNDGTTGYLGFTAEL